MNKNLWDLWDNLILKIEQKNEFGYSSNPLLEKLIGKKGVVISDLKPSGFVFVEGKKYDAQSEGIMIKSGEKVEVVSVVGSLVTVRRI